MVQNTPTRAMDPLAVAITSCLLLVCVSSIYCSWGFSFLLSPSACSKGVIVGFLCYCSFVTLSFVWSLDVWASLSCHWLIWGRRKAALPSDSWHCHLLLTHDCNGEAWEVRHLMHIHRFGLFQWNRRRCRFQIKLKFKHHIFLSCFESWADWKLLFWLQRLKRQPEFVQSHAHFLMLLVFISDLAVSTRGYCVLALLSLSVCV